MTGWFHVLPSMRQRAQSRCWKFAPAGNLLLLRRHRRLVVVEQSMRGETLCCQLEYETGASHRRKTWTTRSSHGRLFIRNGEEMACYKISTDH